MDLDALTFLRHRSLAEHREGRTLSALQGRASGGRLFGYMQRDQLLIPREKGTEKVLSLAFQGERPNVVNLSLIFFRNKPFDYNRIYWQDASPVSNSDVPA